MQKTNTTKKFNGLQLVSIQQSLINNNIDDLNGMWGACKSKAINNLNIVVVGGLLKQLKQGGLFNTLNNINIKCYNCTIKNNNKNYNFTTVLFIKEDKIIYTLQLHHGRLLNDNDDYMLYNSDNKLVFKSMLRRDLIKFINNKNNK